MHFISGPPSPPERRGAQNSLGNQASDLTFVVMPVVLGAVSAGESSLSTVHPVAPSARAVPLAGEGEHQPEDHLWQVRRGAGCQLPPAIATSLVYEQWGAGAQRDVRLHAHERYARRA